MENIGNQRKKSGLTKTEERTLIERLSIELIFDRKEIRRILKIFKRYIGDYGSMNEPEFFEVLHNSFGFTDNFFMKRTDTDKDNQISLEEFIRILHVMLHGSIEEKTKLCFTCYDLSDNMELTREDVADLLLGAISDLPSRDSTVEALQDLVEMIFTKLDHDGDGVISFEEFQRACLDDWIMMEVFGQCLPDHRHRAAFLVLLETDQEIL